MQEVICKELLNQIPLVAATDNEFVDSVVTVDFENVPEDRLATHLHHRLWLEMSFFAETGAKTSSKYDCFHF